MSDPLVQPRAPRPTDDRFAEKARTLIALLGRDGVQSLAERRLPDTLARRLMRAVDATEAGLEDGPDESPPDESPGQQAPARVSTGTGPDASADAPSPGPAATDRDARAAPVDRAAIHRIVALNARPADLTHEHPAVLAMLLAGQSPALKAATLRALPGATARRVLRHLGHDTAG